MTGYSFFSSLLASHPVTSSKNRASLLHQLQQFLYPLEGFPEDLVLDTPLSPPAISFAPLVSTLRDLWISHRHLSACLNLQIGFKQIMALNLIKTCAITATKRTHRNL